MHESERLFNQLPKKWDLADPLPEGMKPSSLTFNMMDNRKDQLQSLVYLRMNLDRAPLIERLRVGDALLEFEKRRELDIKNQLSQDIPRSQKERIWSQYTTEAVDFLNRKEQILEKVLSDPAINASGEAARRLAHQMHLYEAKHGTPASHEKIMVMKGVIHDAAKDHVFIQEKTVPIKIHELAIDRGVERVCEKALKGYKTHELSYKQLKHDIQSEVLVISKQVEREYTHNQAIEKQQTMEKDRSHGLSL